MSAREGIARGARGRRPHRVGLVCLDAGEKGAAHLLLDDLAAATDAYECRAGMGDDAIELLEPHGGAVVDALVIALGDDGPLCNLPQGAQPGTLVYTVLACDAPDAVIPRLEAWCRENGLAWSGALVVEGAWALPATWASPRLGWLRRPVSEGVDALVLALRTGSDAGVVRVRQSPARRAWSALLARLFSARD